MQGYSAFDSPGLNVTYRLTKAREVPGSTFHEPFPEGQGGRSTGIVPPFPRPGFCKDETNKKKFPADRGLLFIWNLARW